jgi:threonylcarbamoyladenosine tRNA methylthiotransferase MtaB
MPPVPGAVVKARAAQLRRAGDQARVRHLQSLVGQRKVLLMERGGIGRAPCFTPARLDGVTPGNFVSVRMTGLAGDMLTAELAA